VIYWEIHPWLLPLRPQSYLGWYYVHLPKVGWNFPWLAPKWLVPLASRTVGPRDVVDVCQRALALPSPSGKMAQGEIVQQPKIFISVTPPREIRDLRGREFLGRKIVFEPRRFVAPLIPRAKYSVMVLPTFAAKRFHGQKKSFPARFFVRVPQKATAVLRDPGGRPRGRSPGSNTPRRIEKERLEEVLGNFAVVRVREKMKTRKPSGVNPGRVAVVRRRAVVKPAQQRKRAVEGNIKNLISQRREVRADWVVCDEIKRFLAQEHDRKRQDAEQVFWQENIVRAFWIVEIERKMLDQDMLFWMRYARREFVQELLFARGVNSSKIFNGLSASLGLRAYGGIFSGDGVRVHSRVILLYSPRQRVRRQS
jgi:hypothetical protein